MRFRFLGQEAFYGGSLTKWAAEDSSVVVSVHKDVKPPYPDNPALNYSYFTWLLPRSKEQRQDIEKSFADFQIGRSG